MERVSLTDQVVAAVRDEILEGRLAPGSSLREHVLAQRFGVGRSTVREAIKVLVAEGLVGREHHRGAVVTRHTAADVEDLLTARLMVERQVAAGPLGGLDAATAALAEMADAAGRGDWRAAAQADERFHRAVVDALGSSRISAFHRQLQAELRLLLVAADRTAFEADKVDEHARLLQLARSGDAATYLTAITRHVTRSRPQLLRIAEA